MKRLFAKLLALSAKAILRKFQPKVIGITGSVGKTSTRQAVFAVLSEAYLTRTNIKNYNNEFGLPLSIIGSSSPGKNFIKWLALFLKVLKIIYGSKTFFPKILVLEYGVDRPGDIDYLLNIALPDSAIFTSAGISHLQYFNSAEQIFSEKKKLFSYFNQDNCAILNVDDPKIALFAQQSNFKRLTYGFSEKADVRILNYSLVKKGKNYDLNVEIFAQGKNYRCDIKSVLGKGHAYAAAAAVAAAVRYNLKPQQIAAGLTHYQPEPSRMRLLAGIRSSIIIDDSYNAAPASMRVALEELKNFPAGIKIAVLGDMLELGNSATASHLDLAGIVIESGAQFFVGVGELTKITYQELRRMHTRPENIFWFENSAQARQKAVALVQPNSVVLVKGSQGSRMEKIVCALLADPQTATGLVCRQGREWH